jgi:hypothetical protein
MEQKLRLFLLTLGTLLLGFAALTANAADEDVARNAWVAIAKLEQQHGIPKGLLHAISLAETGKGVNGKIMPWPYTVGVNSPGFIKAKDTTAAQATIHKYAAMGFTRFDVKVSGETKRRLNQTSASRAIYTSGASGIQVRPVNFAERFQTSAQASKFIKGFLTAGYTNLDVGLMQINWKYHGQEFASVEHALDPYQNANYAVSYLEKHKQTRDWWASVGRYHSGTPQYAEKYVRRVYAMYKKLHNIS